ncbi:MAG: polysaccharide deacetylase family protein [Bryobacteraceae bacterium]|nr:polysaccharide deacetylase family protein [Bryobacteraceae bacterium]
MQWWLWPATVVYFVVYPELGLPLAKLTNRHALWQGDRSVRAMALTFDDGPDPIYTPAVLDLLDTFQVKATFFLVGERARKYPNVVEEIRRRGHEIGNHSDSWTFSHKLTDMAFESDLLRAEASIGIGAHTVRLFRPAGGLIRKQQQAILRKHGYQLVLATGLPFDPFGPPSAWITALTARSMVPGGVVVLHDSGGDRTPTLKALPRILRIAKRRGLELVKISELPR